jgi:hypothetical protein
MNKELYEKHVAYALELLADLEERDANGEFDGNRRTEWQRKYDAFEVAVVALARQIGGEYSVEDLPELAAIYDRLASFVFGSVSAYFFNDDGDCETWAEATGANVCCEDCNADYFQAPCAHSCMGDTIAQYIAAAIDPREFAEKGDDHQHQRDDLTLYK